MPKQIVIAEQHRVAAVFSEDRIQELVVATGNHQVSDIYLGVVENVLPSIDAAFVNIGDSERNGFIHVTDLGPLRLKRSASSITELVAPQQKVLVQIMKEPTGNKGPRLTGNVTLPGRYLVLMPFGRGVHLSRRVAREAERNRLRALAILIKPAGMGLLVRTEAEGVSEEAIIEDLETLQRQWESIQEETSTTRAPALMNRDDDFVQRVLRDMYADDVNRIVVDSPTGTKRVKQHLMNWGGGRPPQGVSIDHHREQRPILDYFRVNAAIREALKPRVDLPSGGYIVIEPTEALTVIDVNSGSFTRSATARETVLWTNCEAATEIARQLRLRNLAGVIIIDFIDMESRRDQLQVLEQFTRELSQDKSRPQIAQLSELGLVELTRKRQGQNIYELFSLPCETCGGLGHIVNLPGEEPSQHHELVYERKSSSRSELRPRKTLPDPVRDAIVSNDLDLDADDDLQELDLISHPSYQELGEGRNNRRRRRRRFAGDTKSLDETLPQPTPKDAPILRSTRNLVEDESEPEEFDFLTDDADDVDEHDDGDEAEAEVTTIATPIKVVSEKHPRSRSRESRDHRDHHDSRTLPEPEVVTVEMTAEEQEVYALMGLSPLLKLDRDVINPKLITLDIIEPGQPSAYGHPSYTEAETDALLVESPEDDAAVMPDLAATSDVTSHDDGESEDSSTPEILLVKKRDLLRMAVDEAVETELAVTGAGKGSSKSRSPRRRRRRSSASS
ncbi:MAG: Rne/Rng family ribonuclease [Oscillatoriales cyanobacterium]|nr:MAG: Rne/Rng family ribonuclease [Oscillatoriales cyanobacterium]